MTPQQNEGESWVERFYERFVEHHQEVVSENGAHDVRDVDTLIGEPKELEAFIRQEREAAYREGREEEREAVVGTIKGMKGKYGVNEFRVMDFNEILDDAIEQITK